MQKHSFHLVDPSPWPVFASLALFGFTTGLVGWFQSFYYSEIIILVSFFSLVYVSIVWWRDVLRESVYQGHHTKAVQKGIMLGMVLFIVSELMLFAGFFWAFGHSSLTPSIDIAAVWPPRGVEVMDPFGIPFLNTCLLLTSGASVTVAHYAILLGNTRQTVIGLVITVVLAIIFTGFQAFEYVSANFTISDSIYGSCFYMLTGLHGAHVIVGTLFLIVCLVRATQGQLRPDHHLGFELSAIYWHFVGATGRLLIVNVRLFLLTLRQKSNKSQLKSCICEPRGLNRVIKHVKTSTRLPLRPYEYYRISLSLANQRLGWLCQPVIKPYSSCLGMSAFPEANTTLMNQCIFFLHLYFFRLCFFIFQTFVYTFSIFSAKSKGEKAKAKAGNKSRLYKSKVKALSHKKIEMGSYNIICLLGLLHCFIFALSCVNNQKVKTRSISIRVKPLEKALCDLNTIKKQNIKAMSIIHMNNWFYNSYSNNFYRHKSKNYLNKNRFRYYSTSSKAQLMVSVKLHGSDLLCGGRGQIVSVVSEKRAKKQNDAYRSLMPLLLRFGQKSRYDSQGCKYETIRYIHCDASQVGSDEHKVLLDFWKRNKKNPLLVNTNVWSLLKYENIWINSFLKLAANQGRRAGADDLQLTDYSLEQIMNVRQLVLQGRFKWGKSRRLFIPKANSNLKDQRQITIPNFQDKLVQEVLRRILSCIFEPSFEIHSHGFRPGRSCHTALSDVQKNFKKRKWIIEGDIVSFFDTMSHKKLRSLLEKRIKDSRFINLIYLGLKTTIIVPATGEIINPKKGVAQGSVLSPLLSNIYLDPLDKYIVSESNVGLHTDISYVRYADDFMIGLTFEHKCKAQAFKNRVKAFLSTELNLELSDTKTLITNVKSRMHSTTNQARFLGYLIRMSSLPNFCYKGKYKGKSKHEVVLDADSEKVISRLARKGFCTKDGVPRPNFRFLHISQTLTNQKVNTIFRGVIEYYKLANNLKYLIKRLLFIFKYSLAKLYAAKYKMRTVSKILDKAGRDLSRPIKVNADIIGLTPNNEANLKGLIFSYPGRVSKTIKASYYNTFTFAKAKAKANFECHASFEEIMRYQPEQTDIITELMGHRNKIDLVCVNCGSKHYIRLYHRKTLELHRFLFLNKKIKDAGLRDIIPLCKHCKRSQVRHAFKLLFH